jgi:hypothetical protein
VAKWDIDAALARTIIGRTVEEYLELDSLKTQLETAVEDAAAASKSTRISDALYSAASLGIVGQVQWARDRAANASNGTSQAVNHYVQGDLEMAQNAQQQAAKAPETSEESGQ